MELKIKHRAMKNKITHFGFIKAAAAVPLLRVGDVEYNTGEIIRSAREAANKGAEIVVFPELCLTGYTAADLFHQNILIEKAKEGLRSIQLASKKINAILIVGLPLALDDKLFNVAAIVSQGKVYGFIPKSYIPGYKEFYEERWFAAGRDLVSREIMISGEQVLIGTDLLFKIKERPEAIIGVEICEDLWVPIPPSSYQVMRGANIIANLSASNDLIGKAEYRRSLVVQQSARGICGYIYASAGPQESTTDVVFGGHAMIAENGALLIESKRFVREGTLSISEIDLEHITTDRQKTTSFGESVHELPKNNIRLIEVSVSQNTVKNFFRDVDAHPFVPKNSSERGHRSEEIFSIQSAGLAKRIEQSGIKKIIIGLSGGLDSTLAILVAVKTCNLLGLPRENIKTFTLPGFATSKRTRSNALELAKALGVSIETIDITEGCLRQLKDIGHNCKTQDIAFENVQARYRTLTLMNKANVLNGLVMGTGDLSELALGWTTFTGDQISHYNVNAGIPKTLVRYLVEWGSEQKEFASAKEVLKDILATPISPELVRGKKEVMQKTEDLVGPYELHDFFLYHFVRWGSSPKKILFLAQHAFGRAYDLEIIKKWLKVFLNRFFKNQWKRSVMPDGPKVGSVSLSPRGDWRMPSDAEVNIWLKEL